MYHDHVQRAVEIIVKQTAKLQRRPTRYEAECAAPALVYLRRRGLRKTPTTLEQARLLDPRERDALRILYNFWSKWTDGQHLAHCQRMISLLKSAESRTTRLMPQTIRPAPNPICGWWPTGPLGVFTKRDWRQKAVD